MNKEALVDTKQLQGLAKAENQHRALLNKCLTVFNFIPNQVVNNKGVKDTYHLASEIEKCFEKFK